MHSVSIAERVLSRFTSATRAASLVGDLEELRGEKGSVWLWLSLARLLVALGWRRFAASMVTFYIGSHVFEVFAMVVAGRNLHRSAEPWVSTVLVISAVDAFLWMTFLYAALRYGIRDRVAQLAVLWAGLVLATILCWSHPGLLLFCSAMGLCLVFSTITKAQDCEVMLVVAATVTAGLVSYLGAAYAALLYRHLVSSGLAETRGLQEHSSMGLILFGLFLMATSSTIAACSLMHAWIGPKIQDDSQA